jgi:hypothetical protein
MLNYGARSLILEISNEKSIDYRHYRTRWIISCRTIIGKRLPALGYSAAEFIFSYRQN